MISSDSAERMTAVYDVESRARAHVGRALVIGSRGTGFERDKFASDEPRITRLGSLAVKRVLGKDESPGSNPGLGSCYFIDDFPTEQLLRAGRPISVLEIDRLRKDTWV